MRIQTHVMGTLAATLVLMVMGSLVHGTGSSLACPDWPLCNGTAFPAMVGGVEFEHTHRLMAATVTTSTVLLLLRWQHLEPGTRRLAGLACGLVALQAALGAFTVVYRLPPAVSIAHLATSMAFLFTVALLSVRLSSWRAPPSLRRARRTLAPVVPALFGQIVLGGVVRHSGAALACDGIPLCNGEIWPGSWLGRVHMAHRLLGLAVACGVLWFSVAAQRLPGPRPWRLIAAAPAVLVMAQVGLGIWVVLAHVPLGVVTLHHAVGAVLLASIAVCWGATGRADGSQDPDVLGSRQTERRDEYAGSVAASR